MFPVPSLAAADALIAAACWGAVAELRTGSTATPTRTGVHRRDEPGSVSRTAPRRRRGRTG